MEPLKVTATLAGAVCIPERPIALDALLAYATCLRDAVAPAFTEADIVPVEIPVQREPLGRFHLASIATFEVDERQLHYTNRRPPIAELQALSPSTKRIQISAGPNKGYHIPREHLHLANDTMTWWCVGDAARIRDLLKLIGYLGKRRAVGLGKVARWDVFPCDVWDGFPVVRDGKVLRNLPENWPGVADPDVSYATLTYPYWLQTREVLCLVPSQTF